MQPVEESDYLVRAAHLVSTAQRAEHEHAYELAFQCYKNAASSLIQVNYSIFTPWVSAGARTLPMQGIYCVNVCPAVVSLIWFTITSRLHRKRASTVICLPWRIYFQPNHNGQFSASQLIKIDADCNLPLFRAFNANRICPGGMPFGVRQPNTSWLLNDYIARIWPTTARRLQWTWSRLWIQPCR